MTYEEYKAALETARAGGTVPLSKEDLRDFERYGYMERKAAALSKLEESYTAGDWETVCVIAECCYEVMPEAFAFYYDEMPEEYRRDFVVGCYSNHGDSLPSCRKALRALPKNGINELPPEYTEREEITVYRAGEETPNMAQYRLSWTTDIEVAKKFFETYICSRSRAQYLYKAKIRPCDVIAYTDDRAEKEVLQYRKVKDIEVIQAKN